jgi:RimJ/RimL family protein N-acetyltransferase
VSYSPSEKAQGILLEENGVLGAIALYDHWTHNSVQMHVWAKAPRYLFNPGFLHEAFWFPFEFGKRGLAFAVTPGDNKPSLAVARALGFKEVYRIKDGWKLGTDMVIQEMRRQDCRWLRKREVA